MLAKKKEYFYEVDLSWNSDRTGTLHALGLPEIEVLTPTEFVSGKKDTWTPEHMLAGAVSSSIMATFLAIADYSGLSLIDYKSHCFVKLIQKEGKLQATEILIRPTITLISEKDLAKAVQSIDQAENSCPVKEYIKA
ncbi:MAG: OsmC family protein [Cytophagales bacterium]|nr:OsmC family protein [Cytophaga sp.]